MPFNNKWSSLPRTPARRGQVYSFLRPVTELRSILSPTGTDGIRVGVGGEMGGWDSRDKNIGLY